MIAVVTASTVTAYALYTMSPETVAKFHTRLLPLTLPFVLYGIFRYLYLLYRRELGGNPSDLLLTDRALLVNTAALDAGAPRHHLRPGRGAHVARADGRGRAELPLEEPSRAGAATRCGRAGWTARSELGAAARARRPCSRAGSAAPTATPPCPRAGRRSCVETHARRPHPRLRRATPGRLTCEAGL